MQKKNSPQGLAKIKIVSEFTLKIIAIVCMAIDHIGVGLVKKMLIYKGYYNMVTVAERQKWIATYGRLNDLYTLMRAIGRIAFPIFCFMLVEGFIHTRSKFKYTLRLLVFGIISEIPFDLMLKGHIFDMSYQNVYFTLVLGLLCIWCIELLNNSGFLYGCPGIIRSVIMIGVVALFTYLSYMFKTDYIGFGVLTIACMYVVKIRLNKRADIIEAGTGCAILSLYSYSEIYTFFMLPLIAMYNGKRGPKIKYLFYIFYPAHLLLIYLVSIWLGYR